MTALVECANPQHDHTTSYDRAGNLLPAPVPMVCANDGRPTHYDEHAGDYLHDDPSLGQCFLTADPGFGTPCSPME